MTREQQLNADMDQFSADIAEFQVASGIPPFASKHKTRVIELQLPYPPSANRLWRRAGTHIHKSSKYTDWLRTAGWEAKAQRPGSINGPYHLSIRAKRPDKRRRDLDNLLKATSDLLTSIGVIADDCDCEMISARWVTTGEGVHVRVEPAGVE